MLLEEPLTLDAVRRPHQAEGPAHDVLLRPFALAARPVTAGEYLEFIADGGYGDFTGLSIALRAGVHVLCERPLALTAHVTFPGAGDDGPVALLEIDQPAGQRRSPGQPPRRSARRGRVSTV